MESYIEDFNQLSEVNFVKTFYGIWIFNKNKKTFLRSSVETSPYGVCYGKKFWRFCIEKLYSWGPLIKTRSFPGSLWKEGLLEFFLQRSPKKISTPKKLSKKDFYRHFLKAFI